MSFEFLAGLFRVKPIDKFVNDLKISHDEVRKDIEDMKATLNGEDEWFLKRERIEHGSTG